MNTPETLRTLIMPEIVKNGGFVNAHAHADRAFTLDANTLSIYRTQTLERKWDAVDQMKRNSTVDDYYRRFCQTIELMIAQGVSAMCSFVDIDPAAGDRAITAALKAREHYQDQITVLFANQTLKGVIDPEARHWFDLGAQMVDVIGALPKRDERDFGRGSEALDIVLGTAKSMNKMVHVHVDQFNHAREYETELLCDKTIEHGMRHRVVAIHGISIAAHSKQYRKRLYEKLRESGVMMIACPMAWIDTPRSEFIAPSHNSLTPVDELLPAGVPVALGTDNICDAMVPFCEGDLWRELSLLSAGCRFMDFDEIVKIATTYGRQALGLIPAQESGATKDAANEEHYVRSAIL
ncbi:MAG: amidohydrolase family protein [Burkholderiales bacterium]|jgi:cytosine/adenosine deaminase-related metal-dependent hydrolase|nr:amidohydrolase family protein [Burkholderiales bacterium]